MMKVGPRGVTRRTHRKRGRKGVLPNILRIYIIMIRRRRNDQGMGWEKF